MKRIFTGLVLAAAMLPALFISTSCDQTTETVYIRDTIYIHDTADCYDCMGAVACYPFEGNANDESGNDHNGTVYGATLATGRKGDANSAYYFKGYNAGDQAYIELPTLQAINNTDEISISMWLKVDNTVASGYTPFTMIPDAPADRLNAHVNYSPYSVYWDHGSISGSGRVYANTPNTYTWDHYVFIKSAVSNKMQVYKNNVLLIDENKHDDISNKNKNIRLGGGASGNQYFAGWMDDVRIFSKALNASEVNSLYTE